MFYSVDVSLQYRYIHTPPRSNLFYCVVRRFLNSPLVTLVPIDRLACSSDRKTSLRGFVSSVHVQYDLLLKVQRRYGGI